MPSEGYFFRLGWSPIMHIGAFLCTLQMIQGFNVENISRPEVITHTIVGIYAIAATRLEFFFFVKFARKPTQNIPNLICWVIPPHK